MSLALIFPGQGSRHIGTAHALVRAESKAAAVLEEEYTIAAGATRAIPSNGSGVFHPALMTPAAEGIRAHLAGTDFHNRGFSVVPKIATAPGVTCAAARNLLVIQLTCPARWSGSVATMVDTGVDRFIEIGADTVLSGLNRINAMVIARVARGEPDDFDGLEA